MSEALGRIAEVLGDGGEDEVAAVLGALSAQRGRQGIVRETPRTPLPLSGGCSTVHSEVEWV
ncbi:hypothetical protein [Streptomyces pseudovenezuelae]|uniref:Uncharacterized protein n=1 Tax=Streptomyces pseudovenezuelae TaxID=67350 RepID=A0ABT6LHB7_9ACTN|nr:hypothetical protein [Streptomyces pseudovenezuelae]MDH6215693.1 hypothetical protein [Streptomyces pseudovenezuelae]